MKEKNRQLYKRSHKKIKVGSKEHQEFIEENYIICQCGYYNKRGRAQRFGTCLRCGSVIDSRAYLKNRLSNIYHIGQFDKQSII